jgi:hypothetical protein
MRKLLLTILLPLAIAPSLSARGWRGIIPLHSTRIDVESLLGKPLPDRDYLYQTEDHFVRVDYAKRPCEGWPSGWNVTTNTVLSIIVRPTRDLKFSDLHLDESKFSKAFDDTFTTYYADRREGIQYSVSSGGIVNTITYFPSSDDIDLRCKCFPAEDGSRERTISFDRFSNVSRDMLFARLDNFAIQLTNSPPGWKGYIILYSPLRAGRASVAAYRKRITNWLLVKRQLDPPRLAIVDGGHRENFGGELFLLAAGVEPPWPLPTVGSCDAKLVH